MSTNHEYDEIKLALENKDDLANLLSSLGHYHTNIFFMEICKSGNFDHIKTLHSNIDQQYIPWEDILIEAVNSDNIKLTNYLLTLSTDIKANNQALSEAIDDDKIEMVKIIVPHCDLADNDDNSLTSASYFGNDDIVRIIMDHCNLKDKAQEAFEIACREGHMLIAKMLLPYADPKLNKGEALVGAALENRIEMVRFLIPISDPDHYNRALISATQYKRDEIIDMLFDHCDVAQVKRNINLHNVLGEGVGYFMSKYNSIITKIKLRENIDTSDNLSKPKNKI